MRDVVNPEDCDQHYGIDDNGPVTELQTCNHFEVPTSPISLTDDQVDRLKRDVDLNSNDNHHGIELHSVTRNLIREMVGND